MPWVGLTWETMYSSEISLNFLPRMHHQIEYLSYDLCVRHTTTKFTTKLRSEEKKAQSSWKTNYVISSLVYISQAPCWAMGYTVISLHFLPKLSFVRSSFCYTFWFMYFW